MQKKKKMEMPLQTINSEEELLAIIEKGEEQIRNGECEDAEIVFARWRKKYGY